MHRARHAGVSSALRRPRTLILAAGVGLAVALWLPTRNDSASARENDGRDRQQSQNRDSDRQNGDRQTNGDGQNTGDRQQNGDGQQNGGGQQVGLPVLPTTEPPATEPPTVAPPTSEPPTVEPPTVEPPTSEPPATTAPPTAPPTSAAPAATAWAPFTDYIAGQLVTFQGVEYQVQQTHTSLPDWEPTKVPSLFKVL
jgi:hypothetical protein